MESDKWQRRGGIISNFTKGETFLISYKNQLLIEVTLCTLLFSQSPFRKTTIIHPSVWASREFTWTVIWKKSLLICFESYWVSPIPTGRVLMVTLPLCVYMINIYCLLPFIFCKEKNRSLDCISSKQRISWRWTYNFYVNKLTKKLPAGKMEC